LLLKTGTEFNLDASTESLVKLKKKQITKTCVHDLKNKLNLAQTLSNVESNKAPLLKT